MGDQFVIQVPHAVIFEPNNHLADINAQMAAFIHHAGSEPWEFEVIYSAAVSKETGLTRVEGKVRTGDAKLEINDIVFPLRLATAVYKGEVTHPRYVRLYSIVDCIKNVLGWSKARGILDNGVWYTQGTKLYEEDGEAATGVGKNKHPLIMDGVGDAIVVLVNLMELTGFEAMEIACYVDGNRRKETPQGNAHYLFHKMRFHITSAIDYLWDVAGVDSPKQLNFKTFENEICVDIEYHYEQMLAYANALAQAYEMTLEQCFSLAWDEIKDRKGFLNADGIFIKEADA